MNKKDKKVILVLVAITIICTILLRYFDSHFPTYQGHLIFLGCLFRYIMATSIIMYSIGALLKWHYRVETTIKVLSFVFSLGLVAIVPLGGSYWGLVRVADAIGTYHDGVFAGFFLMIIASIFAFLTYVKIGAIGARRRITF